MDTLDRNTYDPERETVTLIFESPGSAAGAVTYAIWGPWKKVD
jgi:hypothetical protein